MMLSMTLMLIEVKEQDEIGAPQLRLFRFQDHLKVHSVTRKTNFHWCLYFYCVYFGFWVNLDIINQEVRVNYDY